MQLVKPLPFLALLAGTLFPFAPLHCRKGEMTGVSEAVEANKGPWFTGPLLAPSGHVVPIGFFNFEPYLFISDSFGAYNNHWHAHSVPDTIGVSPQFSFQVGIAETVDFQFTPQIFYYQSQGRSSTHFGDLPIGFDFQLLRDEPGKWYPAIKFSIRESFPTGKYQHLNPNKHGTDNTGSGSFITGFGLVFSRLFHLGGIHYLNFRVSNTYNIPAPVHVSGFNNYGGGFGTRGTVRPGQSLTSIIGMEFTLAQHWVFALDIANIFSGKTTFSGKKGRTAAGAPASVGGPESDQLSFAPAIEYNFNSSVGIIAGCWFSAIGKNSSQFASGVIAVNWFSSFKPEKKPAPFRYPQGGKFN